MRKHVFILQAIILLVFSAEITLAAGLSDTGQTRCYSNTAEIACPTEAEDFYGQDAQFSDPNVYVQQSFTKLNEDGSVWTQGDPENPNPPHVMVRDNVTGLIWAVETGGGSFWDDAKKYCEDLTVGYYSDWRMPTVNEISSIARYEGTPFIDMDYFPNTKAYNYWSSEEDLADSTKAWYFRFDTGSTGTKKKGSGWYYVRAVRCSGITYSFPPDYSSPIKDNGNETVTDIRTGLMWQQSWPSKYPTIESPIGFDTQITWDKAVKYCKGLSLSGFDDWRLPNIKELSSILRPDAAPFSLLPNIHAGTSDTYWSSTTGNSPNVAGAIHFGQGTVAVLYKQDPNHISYVIAVRGGTYQIPEQNGIPEVKGTFAAKADLNRDSRVNLSDAIIALQVCGGMEPAVDTTFGMANIDIDADLKIGMPEAIYILQEVAGIYRCL